MPEAPFDMGPERHRRRLKRGHHIENAQAFTLSVLNLEVVVAPHPPLTTKDVTLYRIPISDLPSPSDGPVGSVHLLVLFQILTSAGGYYDSVVTVARVSGDAKKTLLTRSLGNHDRSTIS